MSASGTLSFGEQTETRFEGGGFIGHFGLEPNAEEPLYYLGFRLDADTATTVRLQLVARFNDAELTEPPMVLSLTKRYYWSYSWVAPQLTAEIKEVESGIVSTQRVVTSKAMPELSLNSFGLYAGLAPSEDPAPLMLQLEDFTYTALEIPVSAPRQLSLFVLAGQSNARGKDPDISPLGPLYRQQPDVLFYNHGDYQYLKAPNVERAWFGPEIECARTLADALQGPIAFVKVTKGSTSLAEDWLPGGAGMYDCLTNAVQAAQRQLKERFNADSRLAAIFWVQGEDDAADEAFSEAYARNLSDFAATLRGDLNAGSLAFIYSRLTRNVSQTHCPYRDLLRLSQESAALEIPDSTMVDADDLALLPDELHFDSASLVKLGHKLALGYLGRRGIEPLGGVGLFHGAQTTILASGTIGARYSLYESGDLKQWRVRESVTNITGRVGYDLPNSHMTFFQVREEE